MKPLETECLSGIILDVHSQENWNLIQSSCAGKLTAIMEKILLQATSLTPDYRYGFAVHKTPVLRLLSYESELRSWRVN